MSLYQNNVSNTNEYDLVVVGGGASGFFAAINTAMLCPSLKIAILEQGKKVLSKVKISGGGRSNVTNSCYEPKELVNHYPRGKRELLGPFYHFTTKDTMEWFTQQGVKLKTEDDGRIFPITNDSQTIIDCFMQLTRKHSIDIHLQSKVITISKADDGYKIATSQGHFASKRLIIATGSVEKSREMIKKLSHTIVPPVPSLFTFHIHDQKVHELMGTTIAKVTAKVVGTKLKESGALLFTHWGFSGPAILKLSAWGARILAEKNYQFQLLINFLNDKRTEEVLDELLSKKADWSKKHIGTQSPFEFTQRFWHYILEKSAIDNTIKWADISKKELQKIATILTQATYEVNGKSTFKEEFVTAGGVALKEVNFKTMESKYNPNLYFVGEVLNIDAITGGFNFQNAWTTAILAAKAIQSTL